MEKNMNTRSPEEQLRSLSSISPDPVFLKWSKRAILGDIRLVRSPRRMKGIFAPFMRPAYAFAGTGMIALALIASGTGASPATSLNGAAIAAERTAVTRENKTAEVRYFKGISPAVSLALADIIDPRANYGSADHIRKGIALLSGKN